MPLDQADWMFMLVGVSVPRREDEEQLMVWLVRNRARGLRWREEGVTWHGEIAIGLGIYLGIKRIVDREQVWAALVSQSS